MSKHFSDKDQSLLMDIMRLRRDVRGNRFTKKNITNPELNTLIEAAITAPSVGFSQPWKFVTVRNQKTKKSVYALFDQARQQEASLFNNDKKEAYKNLKLDGIMEAPVNLAVYYQPSKEPVLGQSKMPEMGKYSVVCAIQNLWLMARAMNIGVGWVSIIDPIKLNAILKAPEHLELVAYLCIGYVDKFLEKPELEQKQWASKKRLQDILHDESF